MAAEFKFSPEAERTGLLTPTELARLFGVDAQTVTRWPRSARILNGGRR
jgi:hypothetical protein